MDYKAFFERGNYYHVFNQGNARENIFKRPENYRYFMEKLRNRMDEHWDLYCWCLMPNHYHFLVRIKEDLDKNLNSEEVNKLIYSNFSHFTNGYAKAINKAFSRRGSLFIKGFRRKLVADEAYLKQLIPYIHLNPVASGMTDQPENWKHSSYSVILRKPKMFPGNEILKIFKNEEGFLQAHSQPLSSASTDNPFDFDFSLKHAGNV